MRFQIKWEYRDYIRDIDYLYDGRFEQEKFSLYDWMRHVKKVGENYGNVFICYILKDKEVKKLPRKDK